MILGDVMNIYKNRKNISRISQTQIRRKNKHLSLDDMVGRYRAIEPINCVELKSKMK